MSDLPDTPPWSNRRVAAVWALFGAGFLLAAAGVLGNVTDARAAILIDTGREMMISAVFVFVGGATVERASAWLPMIRRGGGA